jgi:hypothetical protein
VRNGDLIVSDESRNGMFLVQRLSSKRRNQSLGEFGSVTAPSAYSPPSNRLFFY